MEKIMKYLVDTDILIDVSKGNLKAVEYLETLEDISISVITAMEIIVGARNRKEIERIEEFLKAFNKISINEAIASLDYELLKKHSRKGLTIADSLIAATAKANKITIVTRNVKHFMLVKGLEIKKADYEGGNHALNA